MKQARNGAPHLTRVAAATVAAFALATLLAPIRTEDASSPALAAEVATTSFVAPQEATPEPTSADGELYGELRRICACESSGDPDAAPRQFGPDGGALRGVVNPKDVGACQINERYHLEDSRALGYDIHTEAGNFGYALHLYRERGSEPWSASSACWGKGLDSVGTTSIMRL